MGQMTCNTIDAMLEAVESEIDDPEVEYKLRTVRQLLMVCKDKIEMYRRTVKEADLDRDTHERLVKLGYLSS